MLDIQDLEVRPPGASRGGRGSCLLSAFLLVLISVLRPADGATASQASSPAAPDPAERVEVRLPPDMVFGQAGGPVAAVIFRHTTHTAFTGGQCVACHPQPFKILHPTRRTTHAEMNAGRSCGACHDSRKAFGTAAPDACARCHTGLPATASAPAKPAPPATAATRRSAGAQARPPSGIAGPPQAASAPGAPPAPSAKPGAAAATAGTGDVAFRKGTGSPGSVTFRHATHGGAGARCDGCHPALFAMKAGGTPLDKSGMFQGKTCGACHDGRKAFGVSDGAQCARCHRVEGAGK